MSRDEIFNELKEIIKEYLGESELDIHEDSVLTEDLDLSSLDLISVVGDVEDAFNISIDDDAIMSINTVKDVLDYIENQVNA